MDDDLEDEVFTQTIATHVKFMSKLISRLGVYLAAFDVMKNHVVVYLIKPETIACCLMTIVLLSYLNSVDTWCKLVVSKAHLALGVDLSYKRTIGKLSVLGNDNRTSWELRQKNVGVYALQGRRGKMEDRFSVVFNEGASGIDIYGVFDGHGGVVSAYIDIHRICMLINGWFLNLIIRFSWFIVKNHYDIVLFG